MRGRERRQERREGRGRGWNNRYQMRQKLLAIGDDVWTEDEAGRLAFKVEGGALRVRNTLVFDDPRLRPGRDLASLSAGRW